MRDFEALEELLGRIISYAGLVHAGDTTRSRSVAKFYGDVQEKITDASAHLLFFALELNRIDDAVLEAAHGATRRSATTGPGSRTSRKDKPYQLEDQLEQLFHEKSMTGRGAWNRLFDETMAALRFDVDGEELPLEPTLNLLQDADGEVRREGGRGAGRRPSRRTSALFTLITNTLAKDKEISDRWRGFEDIADSRHLANRVEREVVDALVAAVREAYPRLSHRYYKLKAKWFGTEQLNHLGPQRAAAGRPRSGASDCDEAQRHGAVGLSALSRRRWPRSPAASSTSTGSTRRCGPARRRAPSRTRPCRRRTPMCSSTIMGKPRDVMTLAHELGHGVHQVLAGAAGALMALDAADAGRDRLACSARC